MANKRKEYDARTLRYVARKLRRVREAYGKDLSSIAKSPNYGEGVRTGAAGLAIIAASQFEAKALAITKKTVRKSHG